jgi:hypothetical protein
MEWPEPYVRTIKRDYVRVSLNCRPVVDVDAVADQCPCAVGKVEVDVVHRARFRIVEILDGDLRCPALLRSIIIRSWSLRGSGSAKRREGRIATIKVANGAPGRKSRARE